MVARLFSRRPFGDAIILSRDVACKGVFDWGDLVELELDGGVGSLPIRSPSNCFCSCSKLKGIGGVLLSLRMERMLASMKLDMARMAVLLP